MKVAFSLIFNFTIILIVGNITLKNYEFHFSKNITQRPVQFEVNLIPKSNFKEILESWSVTETNMVTAASCINADKVSDDYFNVLSSKLRATNVLGIDVKKIKEKGNKSFYLTNLIVTE